MKCRLMFCANTLWMMKNAVCWLLEHWRSFNTMRTSIHCFWIRREANMTLTTDRRQFCVIYHWHFPNFCCLSNFFLSYRSQAYQQHSLWHSHFCRLWFFPVSSSLPMALSHPPFINWCWSYYHCPLYLSCDLRVHFAFPSHNTSNQCRI